MTLLDVSVSAAKERAAKYAAAFEPSFGPAGVEHTRRDGQVLLSDRSSRLFAEFSSLVPERQRAEYRAAVMARLSGATGVAAVSAACAGAAKGFISLETLVEHKLVVDCVGSARRKPGSSKVARKPRGRA